MKAITRVISNVLDVIVLTNTVSIEIHSMDTDAVYYSIKEVEKPQIMKRAKNQNGNFNIPNIGILSIESLWAKVQEGELNG